MRTLLFLVFFFCTSAAFASASPSELEADECLPYVICNWLVVELSMPDDACEVTVTTDDVVHQYGTSCGFRPSLSIYGSSTFGLGLHTVRVRARYGSRSSTCTTRVRVEDHITPEIECEDVTVYTDDLDDVPWPGSFFTATDNCEIDTYSIVDHPGGYGTAGMEANTVDESGNFNSCASKYSVRPLFPTYCSVNGNTFLGYINRVRIGNTTPRINNESGGDSGYGFYVNKKALMRGNEQTNIELEPAYTFYNYRMYWRVYIDLNADDDFSDAGEMVYQWNGIGNHSGSFLSPAYPGVDDYRMRVVMSYGGYSSACPSGTIWGEVEDYTVQFYFFFIPWPDRPAASTVADKAIIFPNPLGVGQRAQLQLEANHGIRYIKLSNNLGQQLALIPVWNDDAQQIDLDRRDMQEPGIYLLTATDEEGQNLWTKRWLVQ